MMFGDTTLSKQYAPYAGDEASIKPVSVPSMELLEDLGFLTAPERDDSRFVKAIFDYEAARLAFGLHAMARDRELADDFLRRGELLKCINLSANS